MAGDPRLVPFRGDLAAAKLKGVVEAGSYAEGRRHRVSAPVLDMTDTPARTAGLSTQLLMGEVFTAYEENAKTGLAWGQSATDDYVGYVSLAGLEPEAAKSASNRQVTALATHIYPEPSMKTRPLEMLPMLAQVTAEAEVGRFVALAEGGYCPAQHLGPIAPLDADFVAVAERFLGRPYLWGGRSAEGVDCSGLVQLALAGAGQKILRDTDMQMDAGVAVNAPPERGDLVFWKGHVGIMQSAEMLLHANAHHMAVVSEPLEEAEARILAAEFGAITARRRLVP